MATATNIAPKQTNIVSYYKEGHTGKTAALVPRFLEHVVELQSLSQEAVRDSIHAFQKKA